MKLNQNIMDQIKLNKTNKKILVIGDVMLDQYWFGDVNRISPEAPVPIAKINKIELRPGGAANVAKNIKSLGGDVTLLSVVGNDEAANRLENILAEENIHFYFHKDKTIDTIVKLRIMAKSQQLIRIDFEKNPSHEILLDVLDKFTEIISQYDLVILSDYGKGGLFHVSQMIEIANNLNKPTLIDPKGDDYSKYANATMITPNKNELKDAAGEWKDETQLIQNAQKLKNQLNLKHLLVTRSEEGMTLFTANKHISYPTAAKEVFDVSGAGDTVIAVIGLGLTCGIAIEEAVQLANTAAGIVVGKLGTATITMDELISQMGAR